MSEFSILLTKLLWILFYGLFSGKKKSIKVSGSLRLILVNQISQEHLEGTEGCKDLDVEVKGHLRPVLINIISEVLLEGKFHLLSPHPPQKTLVS